MSNSGPHPIWEMLPRGQKKSNRHRNTSCVVFSPQSVSQQSVWWAIKVRFGKIDFSICTQRVVGCEPLRCTLQLMSAPNSFGAAHARHACAQCTPVSCSAVKASCSVRTLIMFQHSRTELQTMHLSNGHPNEKQLFEPLHNA